MIIATIMTEHFAANLWGICALAIGLTLFPSAQCRALDTLPRVTVRQGKGMPGAFVYSDSGRPFVPVGFNHTILGKGNWHATFNVGFYDPVKMEATLADMQKAGANTIRVWAWGEAREGASVTGDPKSSGVNGAYVANFVDFLKRCRSHKIYVIAILDECPLNAGYTRIADKEKSINPCPDVTDYSTQYLSSGFIKAKGALIHDFIRAVKERDAGLLSAVLAWSLCNEAFVTDKCGPFDRQSGRVKTANGKTYDMASKNERQACWDEGIVYWANQLTKAVKKADPDALVTVGMWTSDAQGRPPVNGLLLPGPDPRYCPRPSALASPKCRIEFLDIHVYPFGGSAAVNLETNEYSELQKAGKPVLVGEYGVFREQTPLDKAPELAREMSANIRKLGYWGPLLWLWENFPNNCTYDANELGLRK